MIKRLLVSMLLVALMSSGTMAQVPAEDLIAQRSPDEVKTRFAPQLKGLQIDIQSTKVELARLLAAPKPDRVRVKAAVSQLVELKRRQQLLLVDQMFDTLETIPAGRREEFLEPIIDQLIR